MDFIGVDVISVGTSGLGSTSVKTSSAVGSSSFESIGTDGIKNIGAGLPRIGAGGDAVGVHCDSRAVIILVTTSPGIEKRIGYEGFSRGITRRYAKGGNSYGDLRREPGKVNKTGSIKPIGSGKTTGPENTG